MTLQFLCIHYKNVNIFFISNNDIMFIYIYEQLILFIILHGVFHN